MRLVPVPLAFAKDPQQAIRFAGEMSRTTHAAPEPVDACRYYGGLVLGALRGDPKETLLATRYSPVPGLWKQLPLCARIDAIAAGSFKAKEPPEIRGTGYVVDALEAALWAVWNTDTFATGALAAVNLGNDADTTGAIYGQLAGVHYGLEGIPSAGAQGSRWATASWSWRMHCWCSPVPHPRSRHPIHPGASE